MFKKWWKSLAGSVLKMLAPKLIKIALSAWDPIELADQLGAHIAELMEKADTATKELIVLALKKVYLLAKELYEDAVK